MNTASCFPAARLARWPAAIHKGFGAADNVFKRTCSGISQAVLVVTMATPSPDSTAAIKLFTPSYSPAMAGRCRCSRNQLDCERANAAPACRNENLLAGPEFCTLLECLPRRESNHRDRGRLHEVQIGRLVRGGVLRHDCKLGDPPTAARSISVLVLSLESNISPRRPLILEAFFQFRFASSERLHSSVLDREIKSSPSRKLCRLPACHFGSERNSVGRLRA